MTDILTVEGIDKFFGGMQALNNVNFSVDRGEIHALVGHNGAGKSTLVKVLTGTYIADNGSIKLNGTGVSFKHTKDSIDKGIGIVTQEGSLIPNFNTIENIFLGQEISNLGFVKEKELEKKTIALMKYLDIDIDLKKQVKDLNPAQRKLVEVMKILNIKPQVLILDEPTAALSDKERQKLFSVMKKLKEDDIAIVFITHYLDEVFLMSDRITVLRNGSVAGIRETKSSDNNEIVKLMIGKEAHSEYPTKIHDLGDVIFKGEGISDDGLLKDLDIEIRQGEIVGLFGTVGAGRTELAECMYGARKRTSGTIQVNGKILNNKNSIPKSIKNGLVLIPDDRLKKSLILDETVKTNLSLPYLNEMTRFSWVNTKKEEEKSKELVRNLNVKTTGIHEKIKNLSGGNKQKVSFGKWSLTEKNKPLVYIFDEPTEGVDVGARAEMYKVMVELAKEGAGILLISSELNEIQGLSDRIYVMKNGEIVEELEKAEISNERLVQASLGI